MNGVNRNGAESASGANRSRVDRERALRQAGAWRSLLAPYYPDLGTQHGTMTPDDAVEAATALLAAERSAAAEQPWSVLERRLAEAQRTLPGTARGVAGI
jgi:hypothetical protein